VNAKAWVYLALFGPGDDTAGPADERPSGTPGDGSCDDGDGGAGDAAAEDRPD
jgi:hypothetical protein